MLDELLIVQKLLGACIGGYLLGSIPFACIAARLHGFDIFNTGSRTAGAANVFWHVGRRTGMLVFAGDVAKGTAAVLIAGLLDLPASAILLAAGAAILGHWNSAFAGFRGGDGMATLMGVTIALEPVLSAMGIISGLVVVLALWRAPLRSTWGVLGGYTSLLLVSQYCQVDRAFVMGLAALALSVLCHSLFGKWRRLRYADERVTGLDGEDALD